MKRFQRRFLPVFFVSLIPLQWGAAAETDLPELSFEDLMQVEVSSPSRKVQSLAETAAAVYVITREMIHRSGATSVPEALRMAPGVEVARISSSEWAVTIRGLNLRFANKLLVRVDGRSVYTPSFSGVYWETLDLDMDDIERIEVVRGPGATLWGANAVNGVVNIITRNARETQGERVRIAGGGDMLEAGARHGGKLAEDVHARLYARHRYRNGLEALDGHRLEDDWEQQQAGFRVDASGDAAEEYTLTGDLFRLRKGQEAILPDPDIPRNPFRRATDRVDHYGANLLGRWQKFLGPASEMQLQFYLDYYDRDETQYREERYTFDLDLQHRLAVGDSHDLIWGLGFQYTEDEGRAESRLWHLDPASRSNRVFSGFVQDEIELLDDRLWLTLGSKLEYNGYTGAELQPNVRLLWKASPRQVLWASVSRAVRTPSRWEYDMRFVQSVIPADHPLNPFGQPTFNSVSGSRDLDSETLLAYELGYRLMPRDDFNLDLALYFHDYERLRSLEATSEPVPAGGILWVPLVVDNELRGNGYGLEAAAEWQPLRRWKLRAAYRYGRLDLEPQGTDLFRINSSFVEGVSPHQQLSLISNLDLAGDRELDIWLRYVDELSWAGTSTHWVPEHVDDYVSLDVRLGWTPVPDVDLSLVGQNLLRSRHLEFVEENYAMPAQVGRTVFATVSVRF